MAPLIKIFQNDSSNFKTLVAVTGQHREMLDQVMSLFGIAPDFDMNLMSMNQSLEDLTAKILIESSKLLKEIQPQLVFVQGDTTTTFSASMASFYQKIKVAHIEAGLRTGNQYSPFPEEINRKMTTSLATYHFPPTRQAKENLIKEGVDKSAIKVTGNTVIDSLLLISKKIDKNIKFYEDKFSKENNITLNSSRNILVTGHRRESFGSGFENICGAIKYIASNNDVQIIYPVHLNPNVQEPVNRILNDLNNVHLIHPQSYLPFVLLMKKAYIILTDSGGVQEEAPSLGKPVLVMRNTTERPEGIKGGTSRLVGVDKEKIIYNVELLLNNPIEYNKIAKRSNPFGDGKSSIYIHKYLTK